jgi:hypothetical protein
MCVPNSFCLIHQVFFTLFDLCMRGKSPEYQGLAGFLFFLQFCDIENLENFFQELENLIYGFFFFYTRKNYIVD